MDVILFGATGMVGQGVLRECLLDPRVTRIASIGRSAIGEQHAKLDEIVHADLFDISALNLQNFDACFFCLGVSSAGMSEADYRRITYDLTLSVARTLVKQNPDMTFIYVSGAGTGGRAMWARVKGETEDALLKLGFKAAYMFRPALIQPMHGIKSRTTSYRIFYAIAKPLLPLLRRFPKYVTTTEALGRAMIEVAAKGAAKQILESADINRSANQVSAAPNAGA
jgi:uncharacterized protein YbjT (DUF2867 family)